MNEVDALTWDYFAEYATTLNAHFGAEILLSFFWLRWFESDEDANDPENYEGFVKNAVSHILPLHWNTATVTYDGSGRDIDEDTAKIDAANDSRIHDARSFSYDLFEVSNGKPTVNDGALASSAAVIAEGNYSKEKVHLQLVERLLLPSSELAWPSMSSKLLDSIFDVYFLLCMDQFC